MSESEKTQTPDISKIISVLMENPRLIEEISALAQDAPESAPADKEPAPAAIAEEVSAEPATKALRGKREQLLAALKPYLSDERQKAIDSMMTFADILDAVRRR